MTPILWLCTVVVVCVNVSHAQFTQLNSTRCYYWSNWGSFSALTACDATCGAGSQQRQRTRACLRPAYRPPPGCRFDEVEQETTTCNSGIACTGTVGIWASWTAGTCSQFCGQGTLVSTRTRSCTPTGLCDEPLTETRTEACTGQGGNCVKRCTHYQTFIYNFGNPISHICLRGSYLQITCPLQPKALLSTCRGDYVKCQVYRQVERYCFRPTFKYTHWG
ncbi:adhesion G protein-coupled receptor B1-like [Haliotis asinina]|uniref:adhesion G protein-coupled receptor B1-like n=1 Tax=Haliotis asinina TaxID=109174 RepID=UPI00353181CF